MFRSVFIKHTIHSQQGIRKDGINISYTSLKKWHLILYTHDDLNYNIFTRKKTVTMEYYASL